EPSSLRKRVDLGEIAVFETTMLTHASADFERARAEGRRRIEDDDRFCAVVDIRQCRSRRIRPLPLRATESGAMDIGGEPTPKEPDPGHTPRPPVDSLPSHPLPHQESEPMTPASRLDR